MNPLPPELLYLVIYNPTLQPSPDASIDRDDEDAAEQAHILFYTAKHQAVSRDTMLRQVGLAKALVRFADMFGAEGECESAHSQSRRMVMISPEPNFWVHACLSHAKSPRPMKDNEKSKGKPGTMPDAKRKQPDAVNDYHYGSLQDNAVQGYLQQGYEAFQLTHGTFASILETRGQQALELQLERFFTVWAWKWDMDQSFEFGAHLGVASHPLQRTLTALLDEVDLPSSVGSSLVLSRPYIIHSSAYTEMRYPHALARHLLARFPPPLRPTAGRRTSSKRSRTTSTSTVREIKPDDGNGIVRVGNPLDNADSKLRKSKPSRKNPSPASSSGSTLNFLTMPNMNMNMNMDVRKWNWGYLTFGKNAGKAQSELTLVSSNGENSVPTKNPSTNTVAPDSHPIPIPEERSLPDASQQRGPEVRVNPRDLEDAMSTRSVTIDNLTAVASSAFPDTLTSRENSSSPAPLELESDTAEPQSSETTDTEAESAPSYSTSAASTSTSALDSEVASSAGDDASVSISDLDADIQDEEEGKEPLDSSSLPSSIVDEPSCIDPTQEEDDSEPVAFSTITVFLPRTPYDRTVERKRLLFFIDSDLMYALVADIPPDGGDGGLNDECLTSVGNNARTVLRNIRVALTSESQRSQTALLSASKILQPKDRFVATVPASGQVFSSPSFSSMSSHLYEGKRLLDEFDMVEVFCRGQSPQHWHISRQGLNGDRNGTDQLFMEVSRKEASLPDVDNDLTTVTKRLLE